MHISTADKRDGHELITPRAIARGEGDEYLVRLNKLFWAKHMRAYIRPLGEPNRCLNVWAAYDCAGNRARRRPQPAPVHPRLPADLRDRPRRRQAERDRHPPRARPACRRCEATSAGCRRRRSRSSGAPCRPARRPSPRTARATSTPATRYVDWVGTDFYSDNQDWKALAGLYRRYRQEAVRAARVRASSAATTRPSSAAC